MKRIRDCVILGYIQRKDAFLFSCNLQKTQALGETTLHFANTSKKTNHGQISLTWPDHYSSKRSKYSQFEKTFTYFCQYFRKSAKSKFKGRILEELSISFKNFPLTWVILCSKAGVSIWLQYGNRVCLNSGIIRNVSPKTKLISCLILRFSPVVVFFTIIYQANSSRGKSRSIFYCTKRLLPAQEYWSVRGKLPLSGKLVLCDFIDFELYFQAQNVYTHSSCDLIEEWFKFRIECRIVFRRHLQQENIYQVNPGEPKATCFSDTKAANHFLLSSMRKIMKDHR